MHSFFAQTIIERWRGLFSLLLTQYWTVTAGDIFSICTSRICFCLFEAKTMLCKYRSNSQSFIFLWTRGINKAVFLKLTLCECVCVCFCQANCPSFLLCFSDVNMVQPGNLARYTTYKMQAEIKIHFWPSPSAQWLWGQKSLSSTIKVWIQVRLMVRIGAKCVVNRRKHWRVYVTSLGLTCVLLYNSWFVSSFWRFRGC